MVGPWSAVAAAKVGREWFTGSTLGAVSRLARVNADNGGPMLRRMVSRTLYQDRPFVAALVQVFMRQGFDDATLMLRTSRDGGLTWTQGKPRAIRAGAYADRVTWRALGQFRQSLTVDVTISDPVDVPLWGDGLLEVA